MSDALGWRMKFGVIAPSTNTIVQPEFDAMRPEGVTNHFGRIHIPNDPLENDDDFTRLIETVRREIMAAIDRVDLRARPSDHGHVVRDVLGRARR
jgi:maleate isomerase